jgi:dTDP-glucose pyrophosphorylase
MKAVILAAGKGTRMGDLTQDRPKPMLLLQGKPILAHIIEGLAANGIREFCLITGWRAEVIEDYFQEGHQHGVQIQYVRQTVQDGTGKAPELAKEFVGASPFLLTYGDILVQPETYRQMLNRFASGPFDGLVTVTRGEDVKKGGLLFFDSRFNLLRVVEKPSDQQLGELQQAGWLSPGAPLWYNAGIYLFRPCLFGFTAALQKSPRGEYELTDAIAGMIEAGYPVAGLEIQGRWVDVRDPEVLAALERSPGPDFQP